MEAKRDKLYYRMKNLARKHWELDKFEREQNDKFIEDENELEKVGKEIFENFGIKNVQIKLFADICSAPGMYSKIVLDNYESVTGIGISLPVEEGGVSFTIEDKRFKKFYKNILDKNYKLELNEEKNLKLDLGMASCVSYQHDAKNAYYLNMELIIKSLMLLLPNLKKGGNLIINMTMKNIELAFNMVNILSKLFNNFKLWKSLNVWGTKNTFYFFGYDFRENYDDEILQRLLNSIKNDNDNINKHFLGTKEEYYKIYNQMKEIYLTRIKAWEKLIN
jgi:hypothetical protein